MPGLKFRVLLDSVEKDEVFRDIAINDDLNFEQFYVAVLDAFGFENDQMASFFVSDSEWNKGEELCLMDMSFGNEDSEAPQEMADAMLREKIQSPKQRFILVHDFISMWIFLIELQEIMDEDVDNAQLLMSVGEIPEHMKKNPGEALENMKFKTEVDESLKDFDMDNYDDDLMGDGFENIDDLDI